VALAFAGAATAAGAAPPLASDSRVPGMLTSSSPRTRALGFAPSLGGPALRAPLGSSAVCSARAPQRASLSLRMGRSGANLVTFGDVWRDACDEVTPGGRLAEELSELQGFKDAIEEVKEASDNGKNKPLTAARSALNAVWSKLTKDADEEEVRKNLAAFARMHGGAVAAPLTEDKEGKEVRYAGLFPDIVDALIEEDLNADDLAVEVLQRELKARERELKAHVSTLEPAEEGKTVRA